MSAEAIELALKKILAAEKVAKKDTLPAYYDGYAQAVNQRDAIRVHADPEVFPAKLFKLRAPNQTDEQHKYVRENYKCTTNPVWQDFITVISRTFIDSNWAIVWPDEAKEEGGLQEYAEQDFPTYGSIEAFVKNLMVPLKMLDANGIMAVHPLPHPSVTLPDGTEAPDDRVLPSPAVWWYPSDRVLHRSEGLVIGLSSEKSEVLVNKQPKMEGRVMYAYTPTEVYRIAQTGEQHKQDYTVTLIMQHDERVLPAHALMGSPMINTDGTIYWRSPFYFATPLLDYALTTRNVLQVSIANTAFPFRIVRLSACDFSDANGRCVSGVYHSTTDGSTKTCPSCNGRGHRVPISPTGEYQWSEPEGLAADKAGMSYKPVEYIEPGTASMTLIREQAQIDTDQARAILHLHTSANKAQGGTDSTATQAALDYSTQFAFIRPIAEQIFDLFEWLMLRVCWQRYGNYDQMPTIIRPQSFDFRTEGQLWEDIKTAREAGAPPFIIQTIFHDLLMNRLSSDIEAQRVANTVIAVDELFALTPAEVMARKASGTVEAWQVILHHAAHAIVTQLMQDEPTWIELEDKERADKLREYAKAKAPIVAANSGLSGLLEGIGG